MNGTGSFDISKITEYFKANSKFTEVRLGEFMDARKDMGFPHWKFDNVVIESVDGGAVVVAPLVHLRLLVQELQREGYKFQQDPKSSVRILI